MGMMDNSQTFESGYLQGWSSVLGPRLHFPEMPSPPIQSSGSLFIHGLMEGIAAAKIQLTDATQA
jgi:hypothetical protein